MYETTTHDAPSTTARLRMAELRLESVAGAFVEGRFTIGAAAVVRSAVTPASFKDAASGVRAWSPPV